ncbi:hypothetical protein [Nitrosopumilus sp. b2]|uniref:hypothetical protein n=1 Tax=Nitrosopumilus sp. b2 TaxID=2109908 RepID=UPI0015F3F4C0|nr:hypothetical protein [Nitrosopumilus sp. b2]
MGRVLKNRHKMQHAANTKFLISTIFTVSVTLLFAGNYAYAQISNIDEQNTLSENLQNDPVAQDLLKKIEQTKKMIEELQQKEYEQNQAQEQLEQMRNMSLERLSQDLQEWERLWEKHSSRNAFDSFVNKKPDYVQGVFWDQFEFKEQKVTAGRNAMNQVLMNGGTMQDAKKAYHSMASTPRIELIEMNAQFNVKHNLADYNEQQVFNSTGQIHMSSVTKSKLSEFYGDYRLQPNYILANSDDYVSPKVDSQINADTSCDDGFVLVSRIVSHTFSCIDESIAKKWAENKVSGIIFHDDNISSNGYASSIETNPETKCDVGYAVVYDLLSSEYRCVLEADSKEMMQNGTAEIHTIAEYAVNKDKKKILEDEIYAINQKILQFNAEYDLEKKQLETKYDNKLENEQLLSKQKMHDLINDYRNGEDISKKDLTKAISEIRNNFDIVEKKILDEKLNALHAIELELKEAISKVVKGHEKNSDLYVDWDYLESETVSETIPENSLAPVVKVSFLEQNTSDEIRLDDIGIVNSIGQKFDEIKIDQVLQVSADITNYDDTMQDFVYVVEIKNASNNVVQPAKWMTGSLNPDQTLNVGLSWIPNETGNFKAIISVGSKIDSVLQIADIEIGVPSQDNIHDGDYCKTGYDLLFKYVDNSPICVSSDTAFKLINVGLAFA